VAGPGEFRGPDLGRLNFGAVSGAVVGSVGGLFAVGIPPAIVFRSIQAMFSTPKIAVICFVISGVIGMMLGGVVGAWVSRRSFSQWPEVVAGGVCGLIPVIAVLWWSYVMVTSY
jgi:hypothetical protein